MAQHQHALVRYVTLDRCLSKFRLSKEELIDRCSEAVNRVTGDDKRLSEKTFFNDIRALREGVVLGRVARIECMDGLYRYSDHGFSLFQAGEEELELHTVQLELERLQKRVRSAWVRISHSGIDAATLDVVRVLLLGDEAVTWAHVTERDEAEFSSRLKSRERERGTTASVSEGRPIRSSREELDKMMNRPSEQRAPRPPEGLIAEELAKWYLFEQTFAAGSLPKGWLARRRLKREYGRVLAELREMGL